MICMKEDTYEIIKYALERIKECQADLSRADFKDFNTLKGTKTTVVIPCVLDYVYENEIKPMWDGGFLKNFLIDYKTGLVSITPIQALRSIEVDIDVDVQTSRKR